MEKGLPNKKIFDSPEDEINFLRRQIEHKENELVSLGVEVKREKIISEEVTKLANFPETAVAPSYKLEALQISGYVLNLSPESHDKKITELLTLVEAKGIKNTLYIVDKLNDPHIADDFHRALVALVKKGFEPKGLGWRSPVEKSLYTTLFEVLLPDERNDKNVGLKEIISSMEQFYASMLAISPENNPWENYFTIEIANANLSEEFVFYVSLPTSKNDLFEKSILSVFPQAKVNAIYDDYNIFSEQGVTLASYGESTNNPIFPINTYETFDLDPLNSILNSFSKIKGKGEGAVLQLAFMPAGTHYFSAYSKALDKIKSGTKVSEAIDIRGSFWREFILIFKNFFSSNSEAPPPLPVDNTVVDLIRKKLSSPIVSTNIRIVASASNKERAGDILGHIEASFNQFNNTLGNGIKFKRVKDRAMAKFIKKVIFRFFDQNENIPLNINEITTIFHFQNKGVSSIPQLRRTKSGEAPAPTDMPTTGVLLGVNKFRGVETPIYMTPEDRLRHFYVIGQTGTGKSAILKNMIIQDINNGDGVCLIDPHGPAILDILGNIPENRIDDVIYFDPSYIERPMALNMLEYDPKYPDQKTFVINELFSIFQKLYSNSPESMGPMFEQYFRNAAALVLEDPETGCTLLDVYRVFTDESFRNLKISRCKNPVVSEFWDKIASKTSGEQSLANFAPYITNKFDIFLSNEVMRPIVSQENSSFNFREIMDNKKILLVNLSKGKLGDINANLIGLIFVGKILMAALSREVRQDNTFAPFYLYIDEFQNVTTNSIATILSEARKYGLSLNIAHQYMKQLQENIRDAIFGNVGSIASFRLGPDDAEYIEKQFEPVFSANDIMNVDNRKAYIKMLVRGRPVKAFSIETIYLPPANLEKIDRIKQLSYLKYGRDRAEVLDEINKKYSVTKI